MTLATVLSVATAIGTVVNAFRFEIHQKTEYDALTTMLTSVDKLGRELTEMKSYSDEFKNNLYAIKDVYMTTDNRINELEQRIAELEAQQTK